MRRLPLTLALVTIAWLCAGFVSRACAFNAQGHQVIALIAYDQLSAETRAKVLNLLRQHPRYEQHFLGKMPEEVWSGSDAEKDGWVFAQAAVWPDLVRRKSDVVTADDVARFNRPTWHYVNFPVFLNDAERQILEPSIQPNLETLPPEDIDYRGMNIIQAIRNSGRVLKGDDDSNRAVHLCWLFHLVGDAHQPLHSSALFTSNRFPDGDKGGNDIIFRGKQNLHWYWDGAILRTRNYNRVRREAFDLTRHAELVVAGERAAQTLAPEDWIRESHALCKQVVYTDHIRKLVSDAEGRENLGAMNPPQDYDRTAGATAKRRAVEAGHRLARLLEQLFPSEGDGR